MFPRGPALSVASEPEPGRPIADGPKTAEAPDQLSTRARIVALIVGSTFFMEQLDITVIATAIPDMARSLETEPLALNLAMTAYVICLAAFIPVSGRLADRFGTRRVFAAATLLFMAASLWCGAATSLTSLVAARILQGIAGAMMAPVGRLIVLRSVAKREVVRAMAWVLLPSMIAPIVGPALGGLITTYASWRWIFFINVPIGIVTFFLILRYVDEYHAPVKARFDLPGFVLAAAAIASAAAAMEAVNHPYAGPLVAAALAGAALLLGFGFLVHARRHPAPILDLKLFAIASYRWLTVGNLLYRLAVGGIPFLLPMALQLGFGLSPLAAGLVVLVPAVAGLVMKGWTPGILRALGFRTAAIVSGLLCTGTLLVFAEVAPSWWFGVGAGALVVFGLTRSLLMNIYGIAAYSEVDGPRMGLATSLFLTVQNLANGFGIALAALAVRIAQDLAPEAGVREHFSAAFLPLAALCLASVAVSLLLDRRLGADMSGHRPGSGNARGRLLRYEGRQP